MSSPTLLRSGPPVFSKDSAAPYLPPLSHLKARTHRHSASSPLCPPPYLNFFSFSFAGSPSLPSHHDAFHHAFHPPPPGAPGGVPPPGGRARPRAHPGDIRARGRSARRRRRRRGPRGRLRAHPRRQPHGRHRRRLGRQRGVAAHAPHRPGPQVLAGRQEAGVQLRLHHQPQPERRRDGAGHRPDCGGRRCRRLAPCLSQRARPVADAFRLHSRPGAAKRIVLDFTGHTLRAGTGWGQCANKNGDVPS